MIKAGSRRASPRPRWALAALLLATTACSGGEPPAPAAAAPSLSSPPAAASTPGSVAPPSAARGTAAPPAPADPVPAGLERFYGQRLAWTPCEGFECARATVPRDYDEPGGATIRLSLVRAKATGPQRIGSLLLNPGGPGGSGVEYARSAEQVLTPGVRARFDVVGFDPRGVGRSTPVDCLTDPETDRFISTDGSPETAAEEQQLVAESRRLAQGCAKRSGPLLPHVGTRDAARDLDVLRAVLGDARLNYLGKSYGTFLGATYAELFPQQVGALVLDGALDPRRTSEEVSLAQAKGFEVALAAFVDDCLGREDCPLEGDRAAAVARVRRLIEAADRKPLRSNQDRPVTEALVTLGIATALYEEVSGWPALRAALREALGGDGSTLLLLSDIYSDRTPDGRYSSNQNEVNYAVNCLDRADEADLRVLRARSVRFEKEAPVFGRFLAWGGVPCGLWTVEPDNAPHAIRAPGARPILVVGTLRDPATPYEWAQGLAEQLESGVLLSWDGDGHTAYKRGSDCVDATVDAYLISGVVPADGKRCG